MRVGERRWLTTGEMALARSVFEDEAPWAEVRVWQAPKLGFGAMVPFGKTIIFSKWRASRDFAKAPLFDQGWFIHELAHVWQASRGTVLAAAKMAALGKDAYAYAPMRDARLADYNIERQAEIVRHLFLARMQAQEKDMPEAEWLEAVWRTR
jgi:hypothetical protein